MRRGVYCGALGWIDTSAGDPERVTADLAVAIRTFTVLGAPGAGCTHSRWAAGSSPTPTPTPSGPRPSSRRPGSCAVAGADADDRSRSAARDRRTRRASRAQPPRRCGSTARWSPSTTARISPFDHGLLVGDGVFETIRVYGGEPFAWTRHLDRLAHSASGLGLPVPDRDALRAAAVRGALGQRPRRGPAAHHRHRRRRAAGFGARRAPDPTVVVASSPLRPWPDVGARRRGAVGAQRPRRDARA